MSTNPDGLELTRVALEVSEGIATVMLDRPDVHNAFDPPMVNELARIWQSLRLDPDVRAISLPAAVRRRSAPVSTGRAWMTSTSTR